MRKLLDASPLEGGREGGRVLDHMTCTCQSTLAEMINEVVLNDNAGTKILNRRSKCLRKTRHREPLMRRTTKDESSDGI